jgi:hypothetical protein
MKNAPQIYVLTLDSSSRKALRVWKGANIHALRHCSVKQIGSALMEMQQRLQDLQQNQDSRHVEPIILVKPSPLM